MVVSCQPAAKVFCMEHDTRTRLEHRSTTAFSEEERQGIMLAAQVRFFCFDRRLDLGCLQRPFCWPRLLFLHLGDLRIHPAWRATVLMCLETLLYVSADLPVHWNRLPVYGGHIFIPTTL